MPYRTRNGIEIFRFDNLDARGGVDCLVTTRDGGVSAAPYHSFNLGRGVGDDEEAVAHNRRVLMSLLGATRSPTFARQVHGDNVVLVDQRNAGTAIDSCDGLITRLPDTPLAILVADCVTVFLYDPDTPAAGIAHAGWRGTVAGIAAKLVAAMAREFGSRAQRLVAAVGPSIGPCCYEVGPEVVDRFYAEQPSIAPEVLASPDFASAGSFEGAVNDDRQMLDLWAANALQLQAAGVPQAQLEVAEICTASNTDRFYSYRAEDGHTGRFAGVIQLSG